MVNLFLNPDIVAREALVLLQSNLVAQRLYSRRYETDLNAGAKVGDTIRIRRRSAGVVDEYDGSTITIRDIEESSINLVLEKHFDASIRVTDKDRTLNIVDFSEQVLAPRMVEMGEKIDQYALGKLRDIPNVANTVAGTATAAPDLTSLTIAKYAHIERTANDLKLPVSPRFQIVSSTHKAELLSVASFVEVDKSGADSALRQAEFGPIMGFRTFMGQNVVETGHVAGTVAGAITNGTFAKGVTSIAYDGATTTETYLAGDIVTIAGYGNVVVNADVTSSSGAGTIVIREPLREAVGDGVVLTTFDPVGGTYDPRGAIFHPDCLAFVAVPLDLPVGTEAAYVTDPATGLSIRAVYDYNNNLKADVLSLDILIGAAMVDGRLGAQLLDGTD